MVNKWGFISTGDDFQVEHGAMFKNNVVGEIASAYDFTVDDGAIVERS